ncbi:MAG: box helicase protein box helicase protein [Candidatus Taylorbacteria bacterium]|nr:box helicase protein box helicase protein [Candidatus Taylorbacteria bacterium]
MRKIVFDIETRNIFEDVGKADPALLDISLVGVFDSETNEYSSYLVEDLPKLWPLLEKADVLITFNGDHFDIPLLNKYYHGDLTKIRSLDILVEFRKALGRRIGLGNIAEATLGIGKSSNGLQAVEWWKKGDIENIRKYCLQDVKVTKDVYEYALKHKKLKYKDGDNIKSVIIDTKDWETADNNNAMTFSLPF